ncbi:YolD-like family protein [Brevibacillus ruminantium]|uniref:YolD-like family protein n=1 Tax=Brevibacillus ruminantium TaxID=2950604 RepID=A0ABY4WNG9_9BACL|nr:YolD-like family protein [Brevibacillus ruminantium]USG67688.1 YolD-like family protein [Brevibacillus ruminantium]
MREKRVSKRDNLFVASRFVLPEHREMYTRMKSEERRYVPPERDEEQQAILSGRVWEAWQARREIMLIYYDGERARKLTGSISHVDPSLGKMKLQAEGRTIWIRFSSLLEVEEDRSG